MVVTEPSESSLCSNDSMAVCVCHCVVIYRGRRAKIMKPVTVRSIVCGFKTSVTEAPGTTSKEDLVLLLAA